jgi:hypothetical protein
MIDKKITMMMVKVARGIEIMLASFSVGAKESALGDGVIVTAGSGELSEVW